MSRMWSWRIHGGVGADIDALEAFCVALGWDYRVKAVQRDLMKNVPWRNVGAQWFLSPGERWWLR